MSGDNSGVSHPGTPQSSAKSDGGSPVLEADEEHKSSQPGMPEESIRKHSESPHGSPAALGI